MVMVYASVAMAHEGGINQFMFPLWPPNLPIPTHAPQSWQVWKVKCPPTVSPCLQRGSCVLGNGCRVFPGLVLAVEDGLLLVRLWSLAFPCLASACGERVSFLSMSEAVWPNLLAPHAALWTPPLPLE